MAHFERTEQRRARTLTKSSSRVRCARVMGRSGIHLTVAYGLAAFAAVTTATTPAAAVSCPAQTFTAPIGSGDFFGGTVSLFSYEGYDYLVVPTGGRPGLHLGTCRSNGVVYYTFKPTNEPSTAFPALQTLDTSNFELIPGPYTVVASNGVIAISAVDCSEASQVRVYEFPLNGNGQPQGPTFSPTPAVLTQSGNFGLPIAYDPSANVLAVGDSTDGVDQMWFYGEQGHGNWATTENFTDSVSSSTSTFVETAFIPLGSGSDWTFLMPVSCPGGLCINRYLNTGQGILSNLQQQMALPSTFAAFSGMAGVSDRLFAANVSGGSVTVYSNDWIATGNQNGTWSQIGTPIASTMGSLGGTGLFGAQLWATSDDLLIWEHGEVADGGFFPPSVYHLFQILRHGTSTVTDDTYHEIRTISVSGGGAAGALDGACMALGDASQGTVQLIPIPSSPIDLCCSGNGACSSSPEDAGTSCSSSTGVTMDIPSSSDGTASVTVDPNCTTLQSGFDTSVSHICATVSYTGALNGQPQICFPLPTSGADAIAQCDPVPQAGCVSPEMPFPNPQNPTLCCRYYTALTVVGSKECINSSSLSTFGIASWTDADNDGVANIADNCPTVSNFFQQDQDHDGVGDACDNCPAVPNQNQRSTTGASVGDACNCALRGVRNGPTGTVCHAVPAVPRGGASVFGGLLLALGLSLNFLRRRRRSA